MPARPAVRRKRIFSADLQKLYDALGLNDELQPEAGKQPQPIHWVKVHNLPEYTRFDHRAHVNAGVACQECHGPVQTMDVIRQSSSLSMGWCVDATRITRRSAGKRCRLPRIVQRVIIEGRKPHVGT